MRFLLVVAFLFSQAAGADELQVLPEFAVPADSAPEFVPVTCGNVVQQLGEWRRNQCQNTDQAVRWMYDIASIINGWHRELRQWEGRTVSVRYGTFRPIRDTAYRVHNSARSLQQAFDLDQARFTDIMNVLEGCFADEEDPETLPELP